MIYGIPSILVCLVVIILTIRSKTLESFPKLLSIEWLIIILLYLFFQDDFVAISPDFDFLFLSFFITSITIYFLNYHFLKNSIINKVKSPKIKPFLKCEILFYISYFLFAISMCKFIYYIIITGSFYSFRAFFLESGLSLHVGVSFPFCAGSYYYSNINNLKNKKKIFSILIVLLALISSSKIFIIISILFISSFYKEDFKLNIKKIIVILSCGFILFSVMHIAMDKIAGPKDSLVDALLFTLNGYLLGGLAVFQLVAEHSYVPNFTYDSLFNFILQIKTTSYYEIGWVRTGEWLGNVYSGFTPWYVFSNYYGLFLYGLLIGVIHSFLDYKAKYSVAFAFMRVFSFYPLLFIVFTDAYLGAISMWFSFSCVAIFISLIKKKAANES